MQSLEAKNPIDLDIEHFRQRLLTIDDDDVRDKLEAQIEVLEQARASIIDHSADDEKTIDLRILITADGDKVKGNMLEYDISSTGDTTEEVVLNIMHQLDIHTGLAFVTSRYARNTTTPTLDQIGVASQDILDVWEKKAGLDHIVISYTI